RDPRRRALRGPDLQAWRAPRHLSLHVRAAELDRARRRARAGAAEESCTGAEEENVVGPHLCSYLLRHRSLELGADGEPLILRARERSCRIGACLRPSRRLVSLPPL